jgi:hypothetical protein
MTNGGRSPEEWGEIYERVRPTLRAFVDKLETLFDELLESYAWCYTWTEHEDSFIDRVYAPTRRRSRWCDSMERSRTRSTPSSAIR